MSKTYKHIFHGKRNTNNFQTCEKMISADLQKECKLKLQRNSIFHPLDWQNPRKFDNYVGNTVGKQVLSNAAAGGSSYKLQGG